MEKPKDLRNIWVTFSRSKGPGLGTEQVIKWVYCE